jgi:dTDP-4-dehydrorhamnose reductase
MRVFVAGAAGQLGSELAAIALRDGHEVCATDVRAGDGVSACDLLRPEVIATALDAQRPDVVINCAAWTKVDDAEREADAAQRLNVDAPRNLARECAVRDLLLIHISTDYVFPGTASSPIDEQASPAPATVYGRTKLEGEIAVRDACPRSQIVRTAWLYGRRGPNFVLTMLRLAREGSPIRVVGDQYGSPTWTGHLAPALLRLASIATPGVYHLTNSGTATWAELAHEVIKVSGLSAPVTTIATPEYPTVAPRPMYSVLENAAWRALGERPLPDWREAVRAYLAELSEVAA